MPISDLTGAPTYVPADTDLFWVEQGGTDYKATRAQIVAAIADNLADEIATTDAEILTLQADRLKIDGTIAMTGDLTLAGAPTSNLHAATKVYVDTADALLAPLASPTFTGTPAAPTAADGTNTTQLATTAFVLNQLDEYLFERTTVTSSPKTLTEDEAGYIGVNVAGAVTITLPTISGLSNKKRVFYKIKDEGFNANASTQIITINRGGTDIIENGATSVTITTAGEDVYLYNDGLSTWYLSSVDTAASETAVGKVELATSAEAKALTDTTRVITPATLADVLDAEVYKATELGASSKTMAEADAGLWYVTYTNTGAVAITLPDPGTLTDPTKCAYEITDAGAASTNAITITASGSATLNGASSFSISKTRTGAKFYNDGTNWFTTADTSTAVTLATSASGVLTDATTYAYYANGITLGGSVTPTGKFTINEASGDPMMHISLAGVDKYVIGLDDSDSDTFKITSGSTLGTNDWYQMTAAGLTTLSEVFAVSNADSYTEIRYAAGLSNQSDLQDCDLSIATSSNTADKTVIGIGRMTGGGHLNHKIEVLVPNAGYNTTIGGDLSLIAGPTTATTSSPNLDGGALYLQAGLNAGTGDSDIVFKVGQSAAANTRATYQEYMRIAGIDGITLATTAAQKVGFFGATPIIQQTTTSQTPATFAANTSGISDDTATWDGYTIGDIVAILRAFGLLA